MAEVIRAPYVNNKLDKHLQYHENKLDPAIEQNTIVLYGEKNNNGLCKSVSALEIFYKDIDERLDKIERNINWGVLLILASFITSLAKLVIK